MSNPQNPKPKAWLHSVVIVGAIGAVVTYVALILLILSWHINAAFARLYERAAGPIVCVTMLMTLVCGVILLKSRSRSGWLLIGLTVLSFIIELFFPEL
jgi:hypothetical protein